MYCLAACFASLRDALLKRRTAILWYLDKFTYLRSEREVFASEKCFAVLLDITKLHLSGLQIHIVLVL